MERAPGGTEGQEPHLRELAARHGARYEVVPELQAVGDELVKVGFELQLFGLPVHGDASTPMAEACNEVYAALREIARWCLPPEQQDTRVEIEELDAALYAAPDLKDRDEIRLDVRIVHRDDFFAPVDDSEQGSLSEMKEKLQRLGIHQGTRRPAAAGG